TPTEETAPARARRSGRALLVSSLHLLHPGADLLQEGRRRHRVVQELLVRGARDGRRRCFLPWARWWGDHDDRHRGDPSTDGRGPGRRAVGRAEGKTRDEIDGCVAREDLDGVELGRPAAALARGSGRRGEAGEQDVHVEDVGRGEHLLVATEAEEPPRR